MVDICVAEFFFLRVIMKRLPKGKFLKKVLSRIGLNPLILSSFP